MALLPVSADPNLKLNFESAPGADWFVGGYNNTGDPFSCSSTTTHPDCNIGTQSDPDGTFFRNERVSTPAGIYWHTVILDPANEFAMEVYTPVAGFFLSNSGGKEPVFFERQFGAMEW